jgi:hypothetical protein
MFVSRRTLSPRKSLPQALGPWALDSGGFSELSMHGKWTIGPKEYASEVRRFYDEIGKMSWAAQQDWMCEPFMLKLTGLTLREHQRRTTENYLMLREIAPDLPWVPVIQGWNVDDYMRSVDRFISAGVDLDKLPIVGVGSVCRRQHTIGASTIFASLAALGLQLHGFGVKIAGLRRSSASLASADSMAWSMKGRRSPPLPGHTHMNCANCLEYALMWRQDILRSLESPAPSQLGLSLGSGVC